MEKVDCLVVGAGVVGLAVARALALRGREVLVCERGRAVGQGTTSRNSEVVHAGLYYEPGSLKARLCVQGREALYRYCQERGIPHRRCGKLVVASSDSQLAALRELHKRAQACGVGDVRLIGAGEAGAMEPHVLCTEALFSPSTGIVDSHALTLSLQGDAEAAGAVVALRTLVRKAEVLPDGGILASTEGMDLRCRAVINCAGLSAVGLAHAVRGSDSASLPEAFFAKGNYFRYAGPSPFRRLVYPLPEPNQAGLGVHATLDLAGQVRFGPDVEWLPKPSDAIYNTAAFGEEDGFDYRVDPNRSVAFGDAIRRYWPDVDESKLVPDYSGIRPKLTGPGGAPGDDTRDDDVGGGGGGGSGSGARDRVLRGGNCRNNADDADHPNPAAAVTRKRGVDGGRTFTGASDFVVQGRETHGVGGLVHLLGIESPGLTASLAIAEHVVELVERDEASLR
ncbi:unnamed protein product [Pylaiella littoralis]